MPVLRLGASGHFGDDPRACLRPLRRGAAGRAGRPDRAGAPRGPRRGPSGFVPGRSDGTAVFALFVTLPWALPLLGVELGDVAFIVPLDPVRVRRGADAGARGHRARLRHGLAHAGRLVRARRGRFRGDGGGGDDHRRRRPASASISRRRRRPASSSRRRSSPRTALDGARATRVLDAALVALILGGLGFWLLVVPGLRRRRRADRGRRTRPPRPDPVRAGRGRRRHAAPRARAPGGSSPARSPSPSATPWSRRHVAGGHARPHRPDRRPVGAARASRYASAAELGLTPSRGETTASDDIGGRWIAARMAAPARRRPRLPGDPARRCSAPASWPRPAPSTSARSRSSPCCSPSAARPTCSSSTSAPSCASARIREEATRRNEELEALTGLATTMTQTLEEAPDRRAGPRRPARPPPAPRAPALHIAPSDGAPRLRGDRRRLARRALLGAGSAPVDSVPASRRRGQPRDPAPAARAPAANGSARSRSLRPATEPFDPHGVELLRLLVDQMGVAVQNARDYREKLEQAIRDPLTGLYNRRFLLEALEKEVQRSARYGSEASLVIFDVDDFKLVNDTLRPRDRRRRPARDRPDRRARHPPRRQLRPHRRRGVRAAAARDLAARGAAGRRPRPHRDRARARSSPDRRVTRQRRRRVVPVATPATADELQRRADAALYWAKRNGKDLCAVASEVAAAERRAAGDARAWSPTSTRSSR